MSLLWPCYNYVFYCQVFNDELFGVMAADRAADGFTSSVSEAKAYRGGDAYCIIARYISAPNLPRLINHLRKVGQLSCCSTINTFVHVL